MDERKNPAAMKWSFDGLIVERRILLPDAGPPSLALSQGVTQERERGGLADAVALFCPNDGPGKPGEASCRQIVITGNSW